MKRKLLILSISFLGLWIAGLFFPGRTSSIHIALIIELVFLMNYLIIKNTTVIKETVEAKATTQPEQDTKSGSAIIKGNRLPTNKQAAEILI